jgi:hypothetical protein
MSAGTSRVDAQASRRVLPEVRIECDAVRAIIFVRTAEAGPNGGGTVMPYRIRWEGNGVYRRFFGDISAAEFHDAYKEMTDDIRYEFIRYIISDYLEAQPGPDFTEEDLKAQAQLERLRFYDSPDTVQAIVAANAKTVAFARYYESLHVSPYCLRTFRTVAEARRWIAGSPRLGWRGPRRSASPAAISSRR